MFLPINFDYHLTAKLTSTFYFLWLKSLSFTYQIFQDFLSSNILPVFFYIGIGGKAKICNHKKISLNLMIEIDG